MKKGVPYFVFTRYLGVSAVDLTVHMRRKDNLTVFRTHCQLWG